jgi:hypothetical protein
MKYWLIIIGFIGSHKIALGLLFTAAVKVMPIPGQPFKPYEFVYDWVHQYLNMPNLRLSAAAVISAPAPNEDAIKAANAARQLPHAPQFNTQENTQ